MPQRNSSSKHPVKDQLFEIIFEADTPVGKAFDVGLLLVILASVLAVILESITSIQQLYGIWFLRLEWTFTVVFSLEYLLRLYCVRNPWKYALSFYGVIDLLAILPTYLSLLVPGSGAQYLLIIRALRLMRIFRIFKLGHFLKESNLLINALKASRVKITVFLTFVLVSVTIIGALMYLVEGGKNPSFSNIPKGIYWAIVTLTTVGYGDITPNTGIGQFFSACVMILGYAVIAVPTGIVSAELIQQEKGKKVTTQACRHCGKEGHDSDAIFCKFCGEKLNE